MVENSFFSISKSLLRLYYYMFTSYESSYDRFQFGLSILSLNKSKKKLHILCTNFEKKNRFSHPVSTRRCFYVYATSITLKRRRMDVQTTSCAYWGSFQSLNINQWCILIVKSKNSIFFSKFQFPLILNWFVKISGVRLTVCV